MTIADKLLLLNSTKTAIAAAIEGKGVTVGAIPFSQYPAKIAEITGGDEPVGGTPAGGWTRPADWLPLPEVTAVEQKMVGLYSVDDDDSNFIAILAQGAYTVDWGDGVIEDFASGVKAEHQYNFATLPAESLSSLGYKQVVVTLTPQAGQNLTLLNLNQRPAGFGAVQRTLQWLDVTISVPNATLLTVAGSSSNARLSAMEQCTILSIGTVVDMTNMFSTCYSLQSVPLFDTTSVTNMTSMFFHCYSLQSVPLFNTTSVTNMTTMFVSCYSLQSVPLFNTTSVTNMTNMFNGCYNLQSVPLFDTASVTLMSGMLSFCYSLQSVPLFNTTSVTNMSSMFSSCYNLQSVPLFDTASVTNMSGMFSACYSLQSVPLFNTTSVTNMSSMFVSCHSLQSVPLFNTTSVTNTNGMFISCYSLQSVPLFNTTSVTNMGSMFNTCTSLARSQITGTKVSISYQNCNLSATALNEIFTNLATLTGRAITITGNPGAATCDRSIATAKGWTVTG